MSNAAKLNLATALFCVGVFASALSLAGENMFGLVCSGTVALVGTGLFFFLDIEGIASTTPSRPQSRASKKKKFLGVKVYKKSKKKSQQLEPPKPEKKKLTK